MPDSSPVTESVDENTKGASPPSDPPTKPVSLAVAGSRGPILDALSTSHDFHLQDKDGNPIPRGPLTTETPGHSTKPGAISTSWRKYAQNSSNARRHKFSVSLSESNGKAIALAVSSAESDEARWSEAHLAELKKLARLHMRALRVRSVVEERWRYARSVQEDLVAAVRKLFASMRRALHLQDGEASVLITPDTLAEWEDSLAEVEGFLSEDEKAGKEKEKTQTELGDIEWEMIVLEGIILDSLPSPLHSPRVGRNEILGGTNNESLKNALPSSRDPSVKVISKIGTEDESIDFDFENGGLDLEQLERAIRLKNDDLPWSVLAQTAPHSTESSAGDGSPRTRLARLAKERRPLDNSQIGSQFINNKHPQLSGEPKQIDSSRGAPWHSDFSEEEVRGFSRFLLHGTPWNAQSTARHQLLMSALNNINFLRAWIWESLEAICKAQLPEEELGRSDNEVTRLSALTSFLWGWLSDPLGGLPGRNASSLEDMADLFENDAVFVSSHDLPDSQAPRPHLTQTLQGHSSKPRPGSTPPAPESDPSSEPQPSVSVARADDSTISAADVTVEPQHLPRQNVWLRASGSATDLDRCTRRDTSDQVTEHGTETYNPVRGASLPRNTSTQSQLHMTPLLTDEINIDSPSPPAVYRHNSPEAATNVAAPPPNQQIARTFGSSTQGHRQTPHEDVHARSVQQPNETASGGRVLLTPSPGPPPHRSGPKRSKSQEESSSRPNKQLESPRISAHATKELQPILPGQAQYPSDVSRLVERFNALRQEKPAIASNQPSFHRGADVLQNHGLEGADTDGSQSVIDVNRVLPAVSADDEDY